MTLYYRDPLECLAFLFSNPLFAGHIDFCPQRVYASVEKLVRVYSEWMTGDSAWEMQVSRSNCSIRIQTLINISEPSS